MMGDKFWSGLASKIGVKVPGAEMVRTAGAHPTQPGSDFPEGVVAVYDNGGKTMDRYTVYYADGSYIGMNSEPFHPQGFGQHGEGVPPAPGEEYENLGNPIAFSALPPECQRAVRQDLGVNEPPSKIALREAAAAGFFRLASPMGWGLYRVEDIDGGLGSIWSIEKDAETGGQFLIKKTDPMGEVMRLKTAAAKTAKIVKEDHGYEVQSEEGKNLGDVDTKGEAEKRLRQVEYFKHHKGSAAVQRVAVAPPGKEKVVKKLKENPDVENPWAVAWSQYDKEKKAAGTHTKCVKCDKLGEVEKMEKNVHGAGFLCAGCAKKWNKDASSFMIRRIVSGRLRVRADFAGQVPPSDVSMGGSSADAMSPMVRSYLETALWAETDNSTDAGGEPLDKNYSIEDFTPEAIAKATADCAAFEQKAGPLLEGIERQGQDVSDIVGHDFWLTRNGHGAGFWDGDYPQDIGDKLTEICKQFGECYIEVGDDKKIYLR